MLGEALGDGLPQTPRGLLSRALAIRTRQSDLVSQMAKVPECAQGEDILPQPSHYGVSLGWRSGWSLTKLDVPNGNGRRGDYRLHASHGYQLAGLRGRTVDSGMVALCLHQFIN